MINLYKKNSLFLSSILLTIVGAQDYYTPTNFPDSIPLNLTLFDTWAGDNSWKNTWTAYPQTGDDVVEAANWAYQNSWELRPSGKMHTWSPITVPNTNPSLYPPPVGGEPPKTSEDGRAWRLILMKTEGLNKMGIISKEKDNFLFWAEPGIELETLLTQLEENGMGLLSHPAPGALTLGGILAVGGHGAGTRASDEKLSPGHSYGSLSNLIVSLAAVVYNETEQKFVKKEFHRSDPMTKVLLVNLGQAFIVSVTMRAGPLQYLRCQSYTSISTQELFANPQEVTAGQRTFASYLDQSGRVEAILFAFTSTPWLKVWTLTDANGPPKPLVNLIPGTTGPKRVSRPYNYPFSDNFSPAISEQVQQIKRGQSDFLARTIGAVTYAYVSLSLSTYGARDIWGPSKNVLLYVKSTTLRYHANGYAIICSRANVQKAIYEAFSTYKRLIDKYEAERKYPINGPLELRVTGVDNPMDIMIEGAESPSISASAPVEGHPEFDTVVWFNVLTYTRTHFTCHFMGELEDEFFQKFDGSWATLRVEWSKGWAYTEKEPWKNGTILKTNIPASFKYWKYHKEVVRNLNSGFRGIFSNQFLNTQLFRPFTLI